MRVPERAQVPSPRRREDPLPQPSYVVLRRAPVNGVPHQDIVRRSVHREVSNLPSDSDGIDQHPLHSSPAHVSAPFGARAPWLGIRPVTQQRPPGGAATSLRFPVGFRPPAFASWASCSRQRIPPSLTVGLPHRHRRLPLLNGQPSTPLKHLIGGGWDHEAYEDSLAFTRPVFPLPTIPGWNENGFGFFPGLRTPRSPMTHAKAGTALPDTGPGHTLIKLSLQSV